jgi:proton-translocating NADH-quinone oxidoreductase chain M
MYDSVSIHKGWISRTKHSVSEKNDSIVPAFSTKDLKATIHILSMLSNLLIVPILGAIAIAPLSNKKYIQVIGLSASLFNFFLSMWLWIFFDNMTADYQFVESYTWLEEANINLILGIDGISLFFILLSTFLVPVCLLVGWTSIKVHVKEYFILFLILETLMIGVFCILDVFLFYVFFESILIPMFLIIGIWGSRERKIRAAYQFFLYTLIGSVFMLLAILFLYYQAQTTDLQILLTTEISEKRQLLLWFAFFCSFGVKVPMVPVHLWLPDAHSQSPTAGSVILAGVLLKLGTYGFLRFSIPLFPTASIFFTPLIFTLSVIGVIYASLTTLRQVDLKRAIAYSSIGHMGFVTLGLFSFNPQGIEGAILLMLSHGFVASGLFLCVGFLYDRTHTLMIKYYGGLVHTMPIFAIVFLFLTFANLGLPGTSSFCGEFLVLTGVFQVNSCAATLASTGMVLGAAYSLWLYNRVMFGTLKPAYINSFADLNRREFCILVPFIIAIAVMGIYPEIFLQSIHCSVHHLLEGVNLAR